MRLLNTYALYIFWCKGRYGVLSTAFGIKGVNGSTTVRAPKYFLALHDAVYQVLYIMWNTYDYPSYHQSLVFMDLVTDFGRFLQ